MEEKPNEKRSSFNWLGIVVFLLFVVGPSLWRVVSQFINRAGVPLPGNLPIPVLVIGAILVAVVVSVAVQAVRSSVKRSETRLPTTLPTTMRPPTAGASPRPQRQNAPMPPFAGEFGPFFPSIPTTADVSTTPSSRTAQLPRPPGFEPIISGKAVLASAGLFSLFGLVYLLAATLLP